MTCTKTIIMGAAGRDFHNFNTYFRDNASYEVIAFTANQIPDIEGRKYPSALCGKLYPDGIDIYPESNLIQMIKEKAVDEVVLAYSDLSNNRVMAIAAEVNAAGADFKLMGHRRTSLKSSRPVVAVCAARTGCGKSQATRRMVKLLKQQGKKIAVIRHPMPYGNLFEQKVQRFATYEDLAKHNCTIEEREEYEPHIEQGTVVFAGVDYGEILQQAESEADIIVWDGGNNDMPFYQPDLMMTIVDPHRPGDEQSYYPGQANVRMADVVVINKVVTAQPEAIQAVRDSARQLNEEAIIVETASPLSLETPHLVRGQRVLVIEDGPTLTHGEMKYGAGILAARKYGAREIVDPRPYAVGSIVETYENYQHIENLLPAMGYGEKQIRELQETINRTPCDLILIATPIDLTRLLDINKPSLRITYELQEIGSPNFRDVLDKFVL